MRIKLDLRRDVENIARLQQSTCLGLKCHHQPLFKVQTPLPQIKKKRSKKKKVSEKELK
jgi:hypothetical protein